MDEFFVALDENLRKKIYPDGFFAYLCKSRKGIKNFLYVFCGIFLLFFGVCTLFGIWILITSFRQGDYMVLVILDLIGIFLCAMLILLMRWASKFGRMSEEDWIKELAVKNQYTESEIREFGNQVTSSDTYILHLDGKLKNNVDTGILTRDYIFFGINSILKISDITLACFTEYRDSNLASSGGTSVTTVTCELEIALLSSKKNLGRKKATRRAGHVLMQVLKERNPDMELEEEGVIKLKELEDMCRA